MRPWPFCVVLVLACSSSHGQGDAMSDLDADGIDASFELDAHTDAEPRDAAAALDACAPFVCGDAVCSAGEDCVTCERDCGPCPCGDGTCQGPESCVRCAADCGGACACGDGVCSSAIGETCVDCPGDCPCPCDDGRCETREWEVCPPGTSDCGFVDFCGNRICEPFEDAFTCPLDCRCDP
jgi:hypothetical protein